MFQKAQVTSVYQLGVGSGWFYLHKIKIDHLVFSYIKLL